MTATSADPSSRPSIALIGMRGAGKSVVARELSILLGVPCLDTDDLVVETAGATIADVFAREGEAGFRRRECEAVKMAVEAGRAVISVGGGAVEDHRNVELLRSVARVIWLTAPAEVLWHRINADPRTESTRPPLSPLPGLADLSRLLNERNRLYANAADEVLDTQDRSPSEIALSIVEGLGQEEARGGPRSDG